MAVFSIIILSTLAIPHRLFSPALLAVYRYRRSLQKFMSKLTGAPSGSGVYLTMEEPVEVGEAHGLEDQEWEIEELELLNEDSEARKQEIEHLRFQWEEERKMEIRGLRNRWEEDKAREIGELRLKWEKEVAGRSPTIARVLRPRPPRRVSACPRVSVNHQQPGDAKPINLVMQAPLAGKEEGKRVSKTVKFLLGDDDEDEV